ncbi:MAG: vanadium-dependent haloperoxidase [Cellulosilyticaceae bacterium]
MEGYVLEYCCCSCDTKEYPRWQTLPYYHEAVLPQGVDPTAGSWPLYFFFKNGVGQFYDLKSRLVYFDVKDPHQINYDEELKQVVEMQNYLNSGGNPKYIEIAKFWGQGVPVNQWTPIALQLITTYKVTPPKAGRILSCLQCVINDAFVMCWYYKYLYNCPRPCQLDRSLKTILNTPRFPAYVSGHSVVSGACEILLSHYFPAESQKLHMLAEDASISRLYGGIHFISDLQEGVKLGRKIGAIAVETMKQAYDDKGNPVDPIYIEYKDAPIMPPYYV